MKKNKNKNRVVKISGESVLRNPKHELFCWVYAGYHNSRLFGNGTRSYMQAYGYNARIDEINQKIEKMRASKGSKQSGQETIAFLEGKIKSIEHVANTEGNSLLTRQDIRNRVDYLLAQYIDNDHSDRELQFVILQRYDLQSKVAAIREFNRLKDRGGGGKLEGNFTFAWESDDEDQPKDKKNKQPTLKKAEISHNSSVEWDED